MFFSILAHSVTAKRTRSSLSTGVWRVYGIVFIVFTLFNVVKCHCKERGTAKVKSIAVKSKEILFVLLSLRVRGTPSGVIENHVEDVGFLRPCIFGCLSCLLFQQSQFYVIDHLYFAPLLN